MSVGFIEHEGVRILLMDFSRVKDPAVSLARIGEARQFVASQPKRKELLTLVDVTRMRYDDAVLRAFRELNRDDEPWEKAVAVCGLTGLGVVVFRAQNLLTGGRLRGFTTREEGLVWLLKQAKK